MNLSRLFAPIALVSAIALSGISGSALADTTLRIGVTPVPHADIVNFIKPTLEKEGVKLEVVEFNDYIQPNLALDAGELDANYFQTIPYLEEMVKSRGLNLHNLVSVHLEPMALYSKKVKRLADIPAGAKVAVPSDPTNEGRALKVLEHAGLIKLKDGAVDTVLLNEACSSGCGSFLQTFASALGYKIEDFAQLGLAARKPVDLGSRCTVFMNSSVKQAQKDGADVTDISAGLSISVVKNALYKVIRCSGPQELGQHIVVQGGTFLNDAVLRAFENELGVDVVRPDIAGLMGAYGAALHAMAQRALHAGESTVLSLDALNAFTHSVKQARCGLCENHCRLTVNDFGGGRRFISGNRCDRPVSGGRQQSGLNLYAYKQEKLLALINDRRENAPRGTIGLPMGLNMYELLPFWHALFTDLGFDVAVSPFSSRKLYIAGQATIPSDTVCFPAKLMHGHVDYLIEQGVKTIFYPCMSYKMDEHLGDNHYNCPVVAYYPEVIAANMPAVRRIDFIHDYVGIDHRKVFPKKLTGILQQHFPDITAREVRHACDAAYAAYDAYMNDVRAKGEEMIEQARREGRRIIVLVGRPYHVDPEINHGIDKLIAGFGAAVVTEDSLSWHMEKQAQGVLNQWTYHARLYAAARYITTQQDMNLVQLVSFGCGVDAITTDEVREILEAKDKIYTQIKIDEITNLGAVRIRLRSLFAAIDQQQALAAQNERKD